MVGVVAYIDIFIGFHELSSSFPIGSGLSAILQAINQPEWEAVTTKMCGYAMHFGTRKKVKLITNSISNHLWTQVSEISL
jgi:hypothetical protein